MKELRFVIPGPPRAWRHQSRVQPSREGNLYPQRYKTGKQRSYENDVHDALIQAYPEYGNGHHPIHQGPVFIEVQAMFGIPKSASKKRRQEMIENHILPSVKPDASNILKLVEDSLSGIVYRDDCLVVDASVYRRYGERPYVTVRVLLQE